jgi:hypothetical protein
VWVVFTYFFLADISSPAFIACLYVICFSTHHITMSSFLLVFGPRPFFPSFIPPILGPTNTARPPKIHIRVPTVMERRSQRRTLLLQGEGFRSIPVTISSVEGFSIMFSYPCRDSFSFRFGSLPLCPPLHFTIDQSRLVAYISSLSHTLPFAIALTRLRWIESISELTILHG